jgi:hypothetical protein
MDKAKLQEAWDLIADYLHEVAKENGHNSAHVFFIDSNSMKDNQNKIQLKSINKVLIASTKKYKIEVF